jgi:hypothetical protein
MNEIEVAVSAAVASLGTGGVSAMVTVKALGVHVTYIREQLASHQAAIERAHKRLDQLERDARLVAKEQGL